MVQKKLPTFKTYLTLLTSALFLLGLTAGCTQKSATPAQKRIDQTEVLTLLTAANDRNESAICAATTYPDPFLRELAALHAASFTDTLLCDCLSDLLFDSIPTVRKAAVYTLGQLPAHRCAAALDTHLDRETDSDVRRASFAAAGKHSVRFAPARLQALYARPVESCDDALLIFAYTARFHGIEDAQLLLKQSLNALDCSDFKVRENAAWTLTVLADSLSSLQQDMLFQKWHSEQHTTVAVPLTRALKHVNLKTYSRTMDSILSVVHPPALLIELLRLPLLYEAVSVEQLVQLMSHPAPGIPALAGKQLRQHAQLSLNALSELPGSESDESRLAFAELRCFLDETNCDELLKLTRSESPWLRSAALSALPLKFSREVLMVALNDSANVVQTTAAEILTDNLISDKPSLEVVSATLSALFETRDSGVIAVLANYLIAEPSGAQSSLLSDLADYAFGLSLPRDAETYNLVMEVLRTAEYATEPRESDVPRQLDLTFLQQMDDTIHCEIVTNRGRILCELYPLHAPASVQSFITLAESGYYNGKFIHRVVPQFVIQSGCPRGDGWGGVDYTIRSEFALGIYREGSIGMASAGRDTESCQWFITHTATPHLNGRYSIFGQVIEGMEIVHQTHRGDFIESLRRVGK